MSVFDNDRYLARRKVLALAGQVLVYDMSNNLICYVKQKLLSLKEDITAFTDKSQASPLLNIKARQVLDFAAAYDIVDSESGDKVGALKRKGLKSIIKDEWIIMDKDDNEIGTLAEASGFGAILSRVINIIPQKYIIKHNSVDEPIGKITQRFSLFSHQFDVDFSADTDKKLDRRLALGAVILLLIIEGRQQ